MAVYLYSRRKQCGGSHDRAVREGRGMLTQLHATLPGSSEDALPSPVMASPPRKETWEEQGIGRPEDDAKEVRKTSL